MSENQGGGGTRGYRGGGRGGRGHNHQGQKAPYRGGNEEMLPSVIKRPPKPPPSEAVLTGFRTFQTELDTRHDKYERLVKCSRDITIESKRTIFLLHRSVAAWSSNENAELTLKEAEQKLISIRNEQWSGVAAELTTTAGGGAGGQMEDPYCYIRAYSPGLQEYIEAASFAYYLRHGALLPLDVIRSNLRDLPPPINKQQQEQDPEILSVEVPISDYLCGLADLTGELMRASINSVAAGDQRRPLEICQFLNRLYGGFSLFASPTIAARDWPMKMRTFRQSLAKVENVCYLFKLRGTEVPDYMLAELVASASAPHQHDSSGGGIQQQTTEHLVEQW